MRVPDFYLASTEGYDLKEPRRCWHIWRLATPNRDGLLLVKIDRPLPDQKYGPGDRDIDLMLLATTHQGSSLFHITEWPVDVHVARPLLDHPELLDALQDDQFELIAWAELYRTEADARLKVI